MLRLMTCALIVCNGVSYLTTSAEAADPAFCKGYSNAALTQVRLALTNPRCAASAQGARWSTDFAVHYQWCLGASFGAAGTERDARTSYLRGCR
jgi:hypothetical protein